MSSTALITALTMAGSTWAQAAAAVFVYRIVSFVLVAVVGWIVFLITSVQPTTKTSRWTSSLERREQPGV